MNQYFSHDELSCPCCDVNGFKTYTLQNLTLLRKAAGFPFFVTSAYRCQHYNTAKGYTQTHSTGQAIDIRISHKKAKILVDLAKSFGFHGIGISQKGEVAKRFIHLDDLPETQGRPRPHVWSY